MTDTTFPRQKIADELSDLRHMRGAMADLISAACRLLSHAKAAEAPDLVSLELMAALSHAERADQIAQDRMRELYAMPTPTVANENAEAAA